MGRTTHERPQGTRSPGPVTFGLQGGMTTIAGEEVVAAGTGEQDFDAAFSGLTTDGMGGEGGDVRGRLIERPDHGIQVGEG